MDITIEPSSTQDAIAPVGSFGHVYTLREDGRLICRGFVPGSRKTAEIVAAGMARAWQKRLDGLTKHGSEIKSRGRKRAGQCAHSPDVEIERLTEGLA